MNYEKLLKSEEKAILGLRSLYSKYGYTRYKMNKFEEYELYLKNKDFLMSDSIITFTGANGKLLALKPDVTLSIIKNTKDQDKCVQKVYYNENVYRMSESTHDFTEIMQTGLECIGDIDIYNICEVIALAAESLETISSDYILDVSHMGFVSGIMDEPDISSDIKQALMKCIGEKNQHEIYRICPDPKIADRLSKLIQAYGPIDKVIDVLKSISVNEKTESALKELEIISNAMLLSGKALNIHLDFSVMNDMNYYNGIVFQGFVRKIPTGILSGGQYDKLVHKMGKKAGAIGFAVYLDSLQRLDNDSEAYDCDILLLYDENQDMETLVKTINMLTANGNSVMAQKSKPENVSYKQLLSIEGKGLEIIDVQN